MGTRSKSDDSACVTEKTNSCVVNAWYTNYNHNTHIYRYTHTVTVICVFMFDSVAYHRNINIIICVQIVLSDLYQCTRDGVPRVGTEHPLMH